MASECILAIRPFKMYCCHFGLNISSINPLNLRETIEFRVFSYLHFTLRYGEYLTLFFPSCDTTTTFQWKQVEESTNPSGYLTVFACTAFQQIEEFDVVFKLTN